MNRILTATLFLFCTMTVFGGTKHQVKDAVPSPKPVAAATTKPAATTAVAPAEAKKDQTPVPTTSGPKGTVITPAPIKLGESTIPGDSEVMVSLAELGTLTNQYVTEEKALQEKYTPAWQADQMKMQQSIQKVKNANKWGDDVVFNSQTKQWIKLDPSEVEAMKKAAPAAETKK